MAIQLDRSGDSSIRLECVLKVRTFEIDDELLSRHLDGADSTLVDEDAGSQLIQIARQRCIDGVRIAGFVRARQSKLDVTVVGDNQAGDFDVAVVKNAHTANLRTRDAEIWGDIYKG